MNFVCAPGLRALNIRGIFLIAIVNKWLKQGGVHFVVCPKQGNKIEGVVLNRVRILGLSCPKQQGQGFKPSAAHPSPLPFQGKNTTDSQRKHEHGTYPHKRLQYSLKKHRHREIFWEVIDWLPIGLIDVLCQNFLICLQGLSVCCSVVSSKGVLKNNSGELRWGHVQTREAIQIWIMF